MIIGCFLKTMNKSSLDKPLLKYKEQTLVHVNFFSLLKYNPMPLQLSKNKQSERKIEKVKNKNRG